MLIFGLNGSPHIQGNTAYLLEEALKAASGLGTQTETFFNQGMVEKMEIPFCTACETPCRGVCHEGTELGKIYAWGMPVPSLKEEKGLLKTR